jgi:hypothetical protein
MVKPITARDARRIIRALHYSGRVDTRSQLHFGVFLDGKCGGALQLGPPINRRQVIGTVMGTKWNEMIDLHRMALSEWMPANGESRVLAVVMRLLRKTYPWFQWVQSYADGTQSGDGAIYRAAGFSLIGLRPNKSMYRMPNGEVVCKIVFDPGFGPNAKSKSHKARWGKTGSETAGRFLARVGAMPLPGFQLRYIYFLDSAARERLTVPIIPFSEIERRGASMYRGKSRVGSIESDATVNQAGQGGAIPTPTLSIEAAE